MVFSKGTYQNIHGYLKSTLPVDLIHDFLFHLFVFALQQQRSVPGCSESLLMSLSLGGEFGWCHILRVYSGLGEEGGEVRVI